MHQFDTRPAKWRSRAHGFHAVDLAARDEGQGLGVNRFLLPPEFFSSAWRSFVQGRYREFSILQRDELLREGLCAVIIADAGQQHLLDQTVLQDVVGPL